MYSKLWGVRAGYLPRSEKELRAWLRTLEQRVAEQKAPRKRSVTALGELLQRDGVVRMYVNEMIDEVPPEHRTVDDVPELLAHLDYILGMAPQWEEDPDKRNFFPMSSLFNYMMITNAGYAAFRNGAFNDALLVILREWCDFLDSESSTYVLNEDEHGWLSKSAYEYSKLGEYVIPDRSAPHWGWRSWNDFFHREIQPARRPVAHPDDPRVIVSPNDGSVYRIRRDVQAEDQFWLKNEPYSLHDMLAGSHYLDRFVGGDVFQSYLSGADYHRWHAPVDGVVRHAELVPGLTFSNLESAGEDIKGIKSQAYYTAVNARGLTFIESDDPKLGIVCVIPVGITEISSITLTARRGDRVKKGDQLGYFSYGGSTVAIVFQRGAIDRFTVKEPEDPEEQTVPIEVNAQIATAR
jgi:phosphatidylserine decarboxylase